MGGFLCLIKALHTTHLQSFITFLLYLQRMIILNYNIKYQIKL